MRGVSWEPFYVRKMSEAMLRLFRFDDPEHGEATKLLPWLVNGTLGSVERAKVERHLAQCAACTHELEHLRVLQAYIARDDGDPLLTHGLARIRARLDMEAATGPRRSLQWIARQWGRTSPWVRGAVLTQAAVLGLLMAILLSWPAPQYYSTLGTTPVRQSKDTEFVVVFNDKLSEREIRILVLRLHARIVDGPSPAGAYTLQVTQGDRLAVLAALRQNSSVIFAEPAPAEAAKQ
jgi:hypothetical protein